VDNALATNTFRKETTLPMFREIQPLQIYDFCTALKTIIFAHTLVAYMIKMNRVLKPSILPVNNLETY
jgi:hypothetical protein